MTITQPQYLLSNHIFMCLVADSYVVLDLRHDKYLSMDRSYTDFMRLLLRSKLENNTVNEAQPVGQDENLENNFSFKEGETTQQVIQTMVDSGIITKNQNKGRKDLDLKIETPVFDLKGYRNKTKPRIRLSHVYRFFKAVMLTILCLRCLSFERVVRRVAKRKRKFLEKSERQNALKNNSAEFEDLVEIFNMLQPWIFTSKDHCLFDSLTLLEFLSYYDLYPQWVLGVRTDPFYAHSWVQDETYIYNDALESTSTYTPIMTL